MNILGIGDGLDAGAALIVDDQLVACSLQSDYDCTPRSKAFPWEAIEGVVAQGQLSPRDIDVVAVGGRFSPPFFLRRHPGLRSIARSPFSPALDFQVFYQALLRQSGMGAFEADRTAEWFEKRLAGRGFHPQRINMVDIHTSLAEGAYRSQVEDDVLVVVLHPMGDGVSCSVHRGRFGQLDRVWEQRGFATLHVHIQRCAHAIGVDAILEGDRLWSIAAGGTPDSDIVAMLRRLLTVQGDRLSRRSYPLPVSPHDEVYEALRQAPLEVAAASLQRNLEDAVMALLTHHIMTWKCRKVVLAGGIFENSRLVSAIAESEICSHLRVPSMPGWSLLPFGAAVSEAGLSPTRIGSYVGLEWSTKEPILGTSQATAKELARRLEDGQIVMRCSGRGSFVRGGGGTRSILVSVDKSESIERLRSSLGFDDIYEPCILVREGTPFYADMVDSGETPFVAMRVPPAIEKRCVEVLGKDGRVHLQGVSEATDPLLYATLRKMSKGKRPGLLAAFRIPEGRVTDSVSLQRLWERCTSIDGLLQNGAILWRDEVH